MEPVKTANKIKCHDCGKKIETENEELKNGKVLVYKHNGKKVKIAKCNDCYKKNSGLKNFQSCEVYSRVVGYIRPVQQWNKGKEKEYEEREEYKA